ncbi:MAG: hypothetical protein K2W94_03035 [Alphaproteobacteria bacterium]|nr:hypothetical protein [Alphaproteobacteria bacterium]
MNLTLSLYPQHPSFLLPDNLDIKIWRYMDFDKFEWLINEKRLFMASSHNLGDSKEGTTAQGEHKRWNEWLQKTKINEERFIVEQNYGKINQFAQAFSKNYYFVNCWHMNEEEDPSRWSDFVNYPDESVAIRTTIRNLQSCMSSWINIGMVKYIDHSKDAFYCREGTFLPNFFEWIISKDKFFEYEKEIRCIVDRLTIEREDLVNFFIHIKTSKLVYAPLLDLSQLILSVHFPSNASKSHKDSVARLLRKENLEHLLKI